MPPNLAGCAPLSQAPVFETTRFAMKSILLFAALVAVCCAASLDRLDDEYENYKRAHKKSYSNSAEHSRRKANFAKVHAAIEAHNARNHSFKMDHNQFSDMHDDEKAAHLGAVHPGHQSGSRMLDVFVGSADRAIPTSLDLRNSSKCVGAIKNQGQCGSCWAFSATAALEYARCIKNGSYLALSEQDLVSCSKTNGCGGGWYVSAWSYVKTRGGQDTMASYPYASATSAGTSSGNCTYNAANIGAKVSSYGSVANNVTAIQQALNTYGTLSIAIYVANDFYSYKSGVYAGTACSGLGINHAVNLVGYGTLSGTPYWIVRNSWGTSWGSSGYILIKSGVNMCNIESYAYYVVAA